MNWFLLGLGYEESLERRSERSPKKMDPLVSESFSKSIIEFFTFIPILSFVLSELAQKYLIPFITNPELKEFIQIIVVGNVNIHGYLFIFSVNLLAYRCTKFLCDG